MSLHRGFISSTVLDLRDLRNFLGYELTSYGYKMLLSEQGNIPADSSKHTYDACLDAARDCDFLIAIIDGRFGGIVPGIGKSITLAEVEAALDSKKQVRIFVRQSVWDAKEILKDYMKDGVPFKKSKIIDDPRVFDVIDELRKRVTGNWIFTFNNGSDILGMLSEQFNFSLRSAGNTDIEKLDKILARKALQSFPGSLMDRFVRDIQIGSLSIDDAWAFDDGVETFLPHVMRFAGGETRAVFGEFLHAAANLNHEAPNVFGPSSVTGRYTVRTDPRQEIRPEWMALVEQLTARALETHRKWVAFFDLVRRKWPDLILELHELPAI